MEKWARFNLDSRWQLWKDDWEDVRGERVGKISRKIELFERKFVKILKGLADAEEQPFGSGVEKVFPDKTENEVFVKEYSLKNGAKINIRHYGQLTGEQLSYFDQQISRLPAKHLQSISEFEFTESPLRFYNQNTKEYTYANIGGSYYPETRKVLLPLKVQLTEEIALKRPFKDVVKSSFHEIGHHYDYEFLRQESNRELQRDFYIIYNRLKNSTIYDEVGLKSEKYKIFEEFFAEMYRNRVVDYGKIKRVESKLQENFSNISFVKLFKRIFGE